MEVWEIIVGVFDTFLIFLVMEANEVKYVHHKLDQDEVRNKLVIDIFSLWVIIVGDFDIFSFFMVIEAN